jgi:hypothetical protein
MVLPDILVETARRASGKATKTATIIYALEEVVRRKRLEGLKAMFGTMEVRVDLDKVRGRRKAPAA